MTLSDKSSKEVVGCGDAEEDDASSSSDPSGDEKQKEEKKRFVYKFQGCDDCCRCAGECASGTVILIQPTDESTGLVKLLLSLLEDYQVNENGLRAFMVGVLVVEKTNGKKIHYAARSGTREFGNVPGLEEAIAEAGFVIVGEPPSNYIKNYGGCMLDQTKGFYHCPQGKYVTYRNGEIGRCAAQRLLRRLCSDPSAIKSLAMSEMWYEPIKEKGDDGKEKYPDKNHGQLCPPCGICKIVIPQILCSLSEEEVNEIWEQ